MQAATRDRALWQRLVAERLRARGLLLPYGHALLRTLALAAIHGAHDRTTRRALVDRALDQLRAEQIHAEAAELPWDARRVGGFHRWVARRFGVTPDEARRTCIVLNARPRDVRVALLAAAACSAPWRRMRAALRASQERSDDA